MIVLDCSAAIGICQNIEPGLGFRALMLEGDEILAPDLFKIEIRNVMWKYVRAGLLDEKAARRGVEDALSLVDRFIATDENIDEAYAESVLRGHAVYDMLYATLARRHACCLFTVDNKLKKVCRSMGVDVAEEIEFS